MENGSNYIAWSPLVDGVSYADMSIVDFLSPVNPTPFLSVDVDVDLLKNLQQGSKLKTQQVK